MPTLFGILLILAAAALPVPPAAGQAVLLETVPADGAVLAKPPAEIQLQYDEPVMPIEVETPESAGRVAVGGKVFSVRPFLCFLPDRTGHRTEVAFFKKKKGDPPNQRLIFEIVGDSNEIELSRGAFQPAINDIRRQFGMQPE